MFFGLPVGEKLRKLLNIWDSTSSSPSNFFANISSRLNFTLSSSKTYFDLESSVPFLSAIDISDRSLANLIPRIRLSFIEGRLPMRPCRLSFGYSSCGTEVFLADKRLDGGNLAFFTETFASICSVAFSGSNTFFKSKWWLSLSIVEARLQTC